MKHSFLISLVVLCMSLMGTRAAAQITGWDEVGPTITGQKYGFGDSGIKTESVTAVRKANKWGFVTSNNKTKIKPKYEAIGDTVNFLGSSIYTDKALNQSGILVKEKGKWGLVGFNGKVLIKPEYDSLDNFYPIKYLDYGTKYALEGRCIAKSGTAQYIVNTRGKKLKTIDADITKLVPFGPTVIGITQNGTPIAVEDGGMNVSISKGQDLYRISYHQPNKDLYRRPNHQMAKDPIIFYNPISKEFYTFSDNKINKNNTYYNVVQNNKERKGIVSTRGELVSDIDYIDVTNVDHSDKNSSESSLFFLVKDNNTIDILSDNKLIKTDIFPKSTYKDFIIYSKNDDSELMGVMKTDGTIITEPKYQAYMQDFPYCTLFVDGKYVGILTPSGLIEFPHACSNITAKANSTELILKSDDNNGVALFDGETGEIIFPFGKYKDVQTIMYTDKYFVKSFNNKWGVATSDFSKEVIPTKYDEVLVLNTIGFYKVTLNNQVGAINPDGKMVIPLGRYSDITGYDYPMGFYFVKKSKKIGIVNEKGTQVVPPSYDNLIACGNNNIMVSNNLANGIIVYIYNKSGKLLKQQKVTNSEIDSYRYRIFVRDWLGEYPHLFI